MKRSRAALFAGLLAFGCLTIPGNADTIHLSGTFAGSATLTPTGPGIFQEILTGNGTDDSFGSFTINGMSTIDFSHPPSVTLSGGMIDLAFSEGTLGGESSGS